MAERTLTFRIFRHSPGSPESVPHLQRFTLPETTGLNLYTALTLLREEHDPSLMFDFSCRSAVCGSCAMLVNGQPKLACRTLTRDLPSSITLMPLPVFKLVGDLSVDTGTWFRGMNERVQGWIHAQAPFDPAAPEARMDNDMALKIYEADRCIECGCCVAACATAAMKPEFLAAAGMNRLARFLLDPRDGRTDAEVYEVVATPDGVFGCLGLMGCHDLCPKSLPLQSTLAYLRRRLAAGVLSGNGRRAPGGSSTP